MGSRPAGRRSFQKASPDFNLFDRLYLVREPNPSLPPAFSTLNPDRSSRNKAPRDACQEGARSSAAKFQTPTLTASIGQIASSFGGLIATCAAMYLALDISLWITLGLSMLAAGFLVRIFIIQHDCGHGSFFKSRRANDTVGSICSLFTLTPYSAWRRQHAGHHGGWNNLDRRASGVDIYSSCSTVAEFNALSRAERVRYRILRHPLVANLLLPPLVFLILYRVPFDLPKSWRRERRGVYLTDLALVVMFCALGVWLGIGSVAAVYLPVMMVAAVVGVWLFSIQHRFERTLWVRQGNWRFTDAALQGSSHLRLPRLLQWFTGNIGLHHVHHLNPRIPNYRLQACHDATPYIRTAPTLSLWRGLTQWRYALWDETRSRMVPFRSAPMAPRPTRA